jgi:predicted  nucleic acid-binding Zn-ribbon protein
MSSQSLPDRVTQLTSEVSHLKEEVNALEKTVVKGNGTPGLTTQIAELAEKVRGVETIINDKVHFIDREMTIKFDNIESLMTRQESIMTETLDRHFQKTLVDRAGKWEVRVALLSAAVAVIIAVTSFITG